MAYVVMHCKYRVQDCQHYVLMMLYNSAETPTKVPADKSQ